MTRRRQRACAALLTAMLPLAGCSSNDDELPEGGECQVCRDRAPQCDSGMTCERFQSSGAFYALCAKPTTKSCPVPFAGAPPAAGTR